VPGARQVTGWVWRDHAWLTAGHRGVNNSWRPTLRVRVASAGAGSRLRGRIGAPAPTLAFQLAWLVGCAYYLVVRGEPAVSGFAAFMAALIVFASFLGRRDEAALRAWLIEELDARERPPPPSKGSDPLSIPCSWGQTP